MRWSLFVDGASPNWMGVDARGAWLMTALQAQLDQSLAEELFEAYVQDVQARAEPRVDQQALNAAQANFQ